MLRCSFSRAAIRILPHFFRVPQRLLSDPVVTYLGVTPHLSHITAWLIAVRACAIISFVFSIASLVCGAMTLRAISIGII